jgi:hypothetical protein
VVERAEANRAARHDRALPGRRALDRLPVEAFFELAQAGLVDLGVRVVRAVHARRRGDGAVVEHIEEERLGPETAAQGQPASGVQVRVDVDPDVGERRREVHVGEVRVLVGRHVAVFDRRRLVDAREVAGLELLPEPERFAVPPGEAAPPEGDFVEVEIDHVAALQVRRLRGELDVLQETGPILEEPHRPVDDEELLRDLHVPEAVLVRRRDGHARGRVTDLVGVLRAVEADAAGLVVVLADDAGRVVLGCVRGGVDAEHAVCADGELVLPDPRSPLGLPVHAEAVGRVVLGSAEGPRRRAAGTPEEEKTLRVVAAVRVLRRQTAPVEPELVVGASRDSEVALLARVRSLEDADGVNELRDDEVRVRVAVAVVVARVVDGDTVDRELEILTLVRVEAAQEDLLGVSRAPSLGEEKPGRQLERVGRIRSRDRAKLADGHIVVGDSEVPADDAPADVYLFDLVPGDRGGRGSRCRRGRDRRRRRRGRGDGLLHGQRVRLRRVDHVGRRGRRGEVEGHRDPAGDRLVVPHRGDERPLAHRDDRRLVEVWVPGGVRHVDFGHVAVDVDCERDVGVLAARERGGRIHGVDVTHHHRGLHVPGGRRLSQRRAREAGGQTEGE